MKGKVFSRLGVRLVLLAFVAGVSGNLVAAEIRDIRVASTESGTRVVLDLTAPVKHKAFLLEGPARIVLDVSRASLSAKIPAAEGVITAMRSGKLPHNGLR